MRGSFFIPIVPKTDRIAEELQDERLHPKLLGVCIIVSLWLLEIKNQRLIITDVHRTLQEQRRIYHDDAYPAFKNIHGSWRAMDVVPENRDLALMAKMRDFVNQHFPYYGKVGCKTALFHDVRGNHVHLQIGPNEPFNHYRWKED